MMGAVPQLFTVHQTGATPRTPPVAEILELVHDCRAEAEKATPNKTKVVAIVRDIGTAIQVGGALQPAYQALKIRARCDGVSLP
jgi:hypothetical protein